ncbi:hypothetical protein OFY05_23645 (plasmid) [Pseudocitrobacter faecalis]|nr:hypothetical protein OFY05_23645 [Pseudocitrobacter faecalis]
MKNIEELRAELVKIGEGIGGGIRPNYYFTIPDIPDGMATPYSKFMAKNIISLSMKEVPK